ncbi:MAG: hypothetical protein Q9227_009408 [Pyrenula ochraceoflavens]
MPSKRPKSWSSVSTTSTIDNPISPSTDILPSFSAPKATDRSLHSSPSPPSPTLPPFTVDSGASLGQGTNPYYSLLGSHFASRKQAFLSADDPLAQSFDFEDIFNDVPTFSVEPSDTTIAGKSYRPPYTAAMTHLSRIRDDSKSAHVQVRPTSYLLSHHEQSIPTQNHIDSASPKSSRTSNKRFRPTLRPSGSGVTVSLPAERTGVKESSGGRTRH